MADNFGTLNSTTLSTETDQYLLRQNGIDYRQSRETLAAGIANAKWSSTSNYEVGSWVLGSDGEKYRALKASGPNNGGAVDPTTYTNTWFLIVTTTFAPNMVKASQLTVKGAATLPTTTPTSYAIGEEIALGWRAATTVDNLLVDSNGNIKLNDVSSDTGSIYYDVSLTDNNTPVSSKLFASIMQCTNASTGEYLQVFEKDTTAIELTNPTATTVRLTLDLAELPNGFKVVGLSEFGGRLEVLGEDEVERVVRGGFVLIENANGSAEIYPDGRMIQRGIGTFFDTGNVVSLFPLPVPFTSEVTFAIVSNADNSVTPTGNTYWVLNQTTLSHIAVRNSNSTFGFSGMSYVIEGY